jgi:sec-independent protein translocase protein TatC
VTSGAPARSRLARTREALAPRPGPRPGLRRTGSLEHGDRVALVDHLGELRRRLLWCTAFLLVAFAACYWQRDRLFDLLDRPLDDRWPLQTLGVTEPFFTSLSVAAQAALVLVLPIVAWHGWRFVRPAIAPDQRRMIRTLLLVAPIMFATGVAFAYLVVLGPAVTFLLGIGPDSIQVVVRASDYYHFVSTTMLAIGAAFCFPLLLLGLARVGILTAERMRSGRRVAYALMVVLVALLPTADPVSLVIEIIPLVLLYEASVLAVSIQQRRLDRRDATTAAALHASAAPPDVDAADGACRG